MKTSSIISSVLGVIIRVLVVVLIVVVIYRGAEMCYDYGYRVFTEEAIAKEGEGTTVSVTITSAMSPWDIGELFAAKGLVRDAKLFTVQYYLSEFVKNVGPGTFELSTEMTAEEMMKSMAETLKAQKKAAEDTSK